jgi:hypothetical protein
MDKRIFSTNEVYCSRREGKQWQHHFPNTFSSFFRMRQTIPVANGVNNKRGAGRHGFRSARTLLPIFESPGRIIYKAQIMDFAVGKVDTHGIFNEKLTLRDENFFKILQHVSCITRFFSWNNFCWSVVWLGPFALRTIHHTRSRARTSTVTSSPYLYGWYISYEASAMGEVRAAATSTPQWPKEQVVSGIHSLLSYQRNRRPNHLDGIP